MVSLTPLKASHHITVCMHVHRYLHPIANPKDRLSYSEYGRVEPGGIFRIHRGWTS